MFFSFKETNLNTMLCVHLESSCFWCSICNELVYVNYFSAANCVAWICLLCIHVCISYLECFEYCLVFVVVHQIIFCLYIFVNFSICLWYCIYMTRFIIFVSMSRNSYSVFIECAARADLTFGFLYAFMCYIYIYTAFF